MSAKESILPFLNPEYWDGHHIGDKTHTGKWPRHPFFAESRGTAEAVLLERVGALDQVIPVAHFGTDNIFDPNAHKPGTLIIARINNLVVVA